MGYKLIREDGNGKKQSQTHVAGLVLLMLGCVAFMAWSIYMATDINRFRQHCEKTIGVMSDYVVRYDEDDDERYVGVFSYEVDGACYEVEEDEWHLFEPELGETATIYYDSQNPSKARFQISGFGVIMESVQYYLLCTVGGIFFFIALAMVLARYKIARCWIYLTLGIAFTLLGIGIPVLTMGAGWILLIWGLVGIYLIVRGYLLLKGDTKSDQAVQDKVSAMVSGVVKGLAGTDTADASTGTETVTFEDMMAVTEHVGRKIAFVRGIKIGIASILIGLVFVSVGIFQIVVSTGFIIIMGIVFAMVGAASVILGIREIIKTVRR